MSLLEEDLARVQGKKMAMEVGLVRLLHYTGHTQTGLLENMTLHYTGCYGIPVFLHSDTVEKKCIRYPFPNTT